MQNVDLIGMGTDNSPFQKTTLSTSRFHVCRICQLTMLVWITEDTLNVRPHLRFPSGFPKAQFQRPSNCDSPSAIAPSPPEAVPAPAKLLEQRDSLATQPLYTFGNPTWLAGKSPVNRVSIGKSWKITDFYGSFSSKPSLITGW